MANTSKHSAIQHRTAREQENERDPNQAVMRTHLRHVCLKMMCDVSCSFQFSGWLVAVALFDITSSLNIEYGALA